MKTLFLPALLILVPAAAHAEDPAGPTAAAAAVDSAKSKAKQKKICVEEVKTGSMFKEQICKTAEEWDALEAQAKQTTNSWSRMSGGRYSGGADGGGGVRSGVGIGGQ